MSTTEAQQARKDKRAKRPQGSTNLEERGGVTIWATFTCWRPGQGYILIGYNDKPLPLGIQGKGFDPLPLNAQA